MKKRTGLKSTALALTLVMAGGGLAAAGIQKVDAKEESSDAAKGRYLEEELTLPEEGCVNVDKICFLEDGTMRIAYRDSKFAVKVADSKDGGETWETPREMLELVGETQAELMSIALSKDGGIFSAWSVPTEDPEVWEHSYLYLSPEGEKKELELTSELGEDFYVFKSEFGANGNVVLMGAGPLKEINVQEGTLVRSYEDNAMPQGFGIVGNRLIVIVDETLHYYDMETGSPIEDESVLTEQIVSREENLQLTTTSSFPVVFTEGDDDSSLFYVDAGGMYHYNYGGSVVEQTIDGSLNSIGSPSTSFLDVKKGEDGAFYLAVQDYSSGDSQGKILKYVYDKDMSAVPSTELKVYTLEKDSYMEQAAILFQKKYPDIYVNVQEGMGGDDAVTATDALKTLNTEIMAGNGPDVLVLDGIPDSTYVERGMLADISDMIDEAGLLENIRSAYEEEDGSIYRMPVRFAIPLLAGTAQDIAQAEDLVTLADMAEAEKDALTDGSYLTSTCITPGMLLNTLADTSAPAWMKEDGTLDEEKVAQFMEQANRIYQAGKESIDAYFEQLGVNLTEIEAQYDYSSREDRGVAGGVMSLLDGTTRFSYGGLYSPNNLWMLTSAEEQMPELGHRLFNGQAENCFFPEQLVGISAKAQEKEAAELFVEFLFGTEGQETGSDAGFPVKESVYDGGEYWKAQNDGAQEAVTVGSSTGEDSVTLEIVPSSDSAIQEIQELGKTLTTPAFDNRIILNAVTDAGKRYLKGETGLEEAVQEAVSEVNLYLSE